jgi:hypothetical protein
MIIDLFNIKHVITREYSITYFKDSDSYFRRVILRSGHPLTGHLKIKLLYDADRVFEQFYEMF